MEALIAHTAIVFARYIALEWTLRKENDLRTIGNLFYELVDEIRDKEYMKVFMLFIDALGSTLNKHKVDAKAIISEALDTMSQESPQWFLYFIGKAQSSIESFA